MEMLHVIDAKPVRAVRVSTLAQQKEDCQVIDKDE